MSGFRAIGSVSGSAAVRNRTEEFESGQYFPRQGTRSSGFGRLHRRLPLEDPRGLVGSRTGGKEGAVPITNIADVEEQLRGQPKARDLHAIWEERQPMANLDPKKGRYGVVERGRIPWLEDVALGARFTAQALRAEEFLLVVDAARELLAGWQNAGEEHATSLVHIRMDYAMALARLGFSGKARQELEPCVSEGARPQMGRRLKADVLLQMGHILREEWHESTERAAQLLSAEEALGFYRRALASEPERLEALVHSASTAFMLAEQNEELRGQAQATARQILKLAAEREETQVAGLRTTWARATAQAILGEMDAAYRSFEQLRGMSTAELAEVRYEAQFLAEAHGRPRDYFQGAFPPLQLIVFAGHMPDRSDGPVRLPASSIDGAREALRARLKSMEARVGLVSASAGADLLFTEALRELDGAFHLVLPWSQEEFRRTSVAPFEPPAGPALWGPLFDRALKEAASTRELGQVYEPAGDLGWEYMMEVTAGIALQTARALRLDVQPMVLWNGQAGWGAGGTDSFYAFWERRLGVKPIVVPPPPVAAAGSAQAGGGSGGCERAILHQEVKSMLFADIVGYSKLTEKAIPEFIGTFLERVGRLAANSRHAPCSVNTWGDAVYAVFDFARDAGLFALELAQMVEEGKSDWLAKGLYWESRSGQGEVEKHALNIRIGLHTGPVVMHYDPIVRRLGFTGAHVNRAARIEPVAEPGQVFASEEFAAMAELSGERRDLGFVCEYAGSMQLAKGYPGWHRLYRLAPKRVLALEPLARAVHEAYCAELQGKVQPGHPALVSWEELSEDLRDANRAQVADIPNKLRLLGYELAPAHGLPASAIAITDAEVEAMAVREHDRWMEERRRQGWSYASERDNARKFHPLLVEWSRLDEKERKKDRDTIRNLPLLVERAGFRVRRLG
jgi:class 3 adenylate cyclase